jgi:3-oxoadipate enol-lactonase
VSPQLTRGQLDTSTPPGLMAGIAGRVPGAAYQELPGTPHMQTLERPELVAAALNEFLPAEAVDKVET